jgi:TonB family protein
MRGLKLALYLIVVAATAAWAQQTPAPAADQPAAAPIVRGPHSTKADLAVPLCPATFNDSLETDGIAGRSDKNVTPPIARYQPEAEMSDEARRLHRSGQILNFEVVISLVVDSTGRPQGVCVRRSSGYGLDAQAAKSVEQYQFDPATKDGVHVAKRIFVEVNFRAW